MDLSPHVITVGLVIGSFAIVVVCINVLFRKAFGSGGLALCVVGVLLIGLSVYSRVKIDVKGFKAEFEGVKTRLATVEQTNEAMQEDLEDVADDVVESKTQLRLLAGAVRNAPGVNLERLNQIEQALESGPIRLRSVKPKPNTQR